MIAIPLHASQGFAFVDESDLYLLELFKWWAKPCARTCYAYTYSSASGRRVNVMMHRLIMGLRSDDSRVVDHINGNGLDNRRSNLRIATLGENARNTRRKTPKSGFRGVDQVSAEKWRAKIMVDRELVELGYFASAKEAAEAYDAAALQLHGEFATLNFGSRFEFGQSGAAA